MEVVRAFNNELSSLYEVRPPISKAKMTQITKCAIKGIKFYKHIVQSVEKFIQKCRPEYKVPGLYVVDSIVRQSRHQFGADKDVFAPRFTKNIMLTFQNLFKCAEEDRPKIVRVLNLWQKNSVFPSDVIQPLLDMANPNNTGGSYEASRLAASESPVHKSLQHSAPSENLLSQNSKHKSHEMSAWKGWSHSSQVNDESVQDSHQFPEISAGNVEKVAKGEISLQSRDDMLPHLTHVNNQSHVNKVLDVNPPDESTVKFNKVHGVLKSVSEELQQTKLEKTLLAWCRDITKEPHLLDYDAFRIAYQYLGIDKLLDPKGEKKAGLKQGKRVSDKGIGNPQKVRTAAKKDVKQQYTFYISNIEKSSHVPAVRDGILHKFNIQLLFLNSQHHLMGPFMGYAQGGVQSHRDYERLRTDLSQLEVHGRRLVFLPDQEYYTRMLHRNFLMIYNRNRSLQ